MSNFNLNKLFKGVSISKHENIILKFKQKTRMNNVFILFLCISSIQFILSIQFNNNGIGILEIPAILLKTAKYRSIKCRADFYY